MSFPIAVQSAIFYVVACTPCAQAREHRQSKKRALKAREEKTRLEAEMPDLYRHPDPFNTNPYWTEEIMMGPSLPSKKNNGGSKNASQGGLASGGRDSRSNTASSIGVGSTTIGSSPTVVPEEDGKLSLSTTMSMSVSDDWNKTRYQREDEELWGREISYAGHKLMDAIKQAGTSAGRMIEATLGKEPKAITEEDRYHFYSPKVPPVNDYHPPVVSQRPKDKAAAKWMLQPPPPAKVMEGKIPVSRSTSMASQASRRTIASDTPALGRLVHEKMVASKLRKGEMPSEVELPAALNRPPPRRRSTAGSRGGRSQRGARSRSLSLESSDTSDDLRRRRRPRARPPINPDMDSSEDEEYLRGSVDSLAMMRAAQRPRLQTIFSSQRSVSPSKSPVASASQFSPLRDTANTQPQPKAEVEERDEPHKIDEPAPGLTATAVHA